MAAAIVAQGVGLSTIVLLAPGVLLLPDGRIPSPRWRWVWRTCLVLSAVLVLGQFVAAFSYLGQHIRIASSGQPENTPTGVLGVFGFSYLAILGLLPIWIALVVPGVRGRRYLAREIYQHVMVDYRARQATPQAA